MVENVEGHQIARDVVVDEVVLQSAATAATAEDLLEKIVGWGRFKELLGYSPDAVIRHLMQPSATPATGP